jgi:dUTP pyrophosphatase
MELKFKKLHPDAIAPVYATAGAACFDLHALVLTESDAVSDGNPVTVRTGLSFEVPEGYVMEIYSRSGHGFKNSVRLANCVGIIDSDYRGEVMLRLAKDASPAPLMWIRNGDRIAQAMIVPIPQVQLTEVTDLSETDRGSGGFGSTGA